MPEASTAEIDRPARNYSWSYGGQVNTWVNAMVAASTTAPHAEARSIPPGYTSLRRAADSLDHSMWCGFGCAEVAKRFLADGHETSNRGAGFGPRRKRVVASLKEAFLSGKLTLYVVADEVSWKQRNQQVPSWAKEPIALPNELLGCVFAEDDHGRIAASFGVRPSPKLVGNDKLLAVLNCGHDLVVREADFRRWLRSERRKAIWPSQALAHTTPKRKAVGRPAKLTAGLKAAIITAGRTNAWVGARPVTELHRLLSGQDLDVPSVDTLTRIVDALFTETGESWLCRPRRIRRRQPAQHLPQNPASLRKIF